MHHLVRLGSIVALAGFSASAAWAAAPTQSQYAVNLGTGTVSATFVPGQLMQWFDSANSAVTGGAPRPVSNEYPMPVAIVSGSSGGGGGGSTPTTAAGTASPQLVGVQGGGSGALPVAVTLGSTTISLGVGSNVIGGVTQSGPWSMAVTSLPALPAGGNAIGSVSVSNFPATQPVSGSITALPRGTATYTQTSVTIPASTSTSLIAANATRRALAVIPNNATCFLNSAGGTASATSMPAPGGWNWTELDPPPAGAVAAFCTTATTISVSEAN